jgi:hypothetical protein
MARYPRNSKVTKALLSADSNVKKAKNIQYGSDIVAPKVLKELEDLSKKRKEDKKVYEGVESFLKKKGMTDIMIPSYSAFVKGESANYQGMPIDMDMLYQMSFIADPDKRKKLKDFGKFLTANEKQNNIQSTLDMLSKSIKGDM